MMSTRLAFQLLVIIVSQRISQANALVYHDFDEKWDQETAKFARLHVGNEFDMLVQTDHDNTYPHFESFYVDLHTTSPNRTTEIVDRFCNYVEAYLKDKNVFVQIHRESLKFFSDCLKTSSKIRNEEKLENLTVLIKGSHTDLTSAEPLKQLQSMRIKIGLALTEQDLPVDTQDLMLQYRNLNLTIHEVVVEYEVKPGFFYDYHTFVEIVDIDYSKYNYFKDKIHVVLHPIFDQSDPLWTDSYKTLSVKYFYRWSESKMIPVIVSNYIETFGSLDDHASLLRLKQSIFSYHGIAIFMNFLDFVETIEGQYLDFFKSSHVCADLSFIMISFYSDHKDVYPLMMDLAELHYNLPCEIKWTVWWEMSNDVIHNQRLQKLQNIQTKFPGLISHIFVVLSRVVNKKWQTFPDDQDQTTVPRIKSFSEISNHSLSFRVGRKIDLSTLVIHNISDAERFWANHLNASMGLHIQNYETDPITPARWSNLTRQIMKEGQTKVLIDFVFDISKKSEYGGCFEYKKQMNTLKNWVAVNAYEVVITSPQPTNFFQYSDPRWRKTWYKDAAIFGDRYIFSNATKEEIKYLSNFKDTCVTLPMAVPKAPVNFSTAYSGVVVDLRQETYLKIKTEQLADLFRLIHFKFGTLEILVKHVDTLRTVIKAIQSIDSDEGSHNNEVIKYYLNIDPLRITQFESNSKFHGVHFTFCQCENDTVRLQSLRKVLVNAVGINILLKEVQNLTDNELWKTLVRHLDYVVIRFNLAEELLMSARNEAYSNILRNTFTDYIQFNSHEILPNPVFDQIRAMRLNLRRANPNITVYMQIAWPTIEHRKSLQRTQKLWEFLNDFSKTFEFPFFLYEAFDDKSMDVITKTDLKYGWWKLINGSDIYNPSNYIDKQAEFYKLETKRPARAHHRRDKMTLPFPIIETLTGLATLLLLVICAAVVVIFRLRRRAQMLLTKEELQEFRMGTFGPSSDSDPDNDYTSIAYDKEKYEIDKLAFQFGNHSLKVPKIQGKVELLSVLREIKLMSFVGEHENILKLVGAYTKEIHKGIVYVITEFAENGCLLDHLRELGRSETSKGSVTMSLYQFCLGISRGMHFLSEKKVVHGDLSARNVLLDENNVCKICDFGLSRKLYDMNLYVKTSSDPVPWKWMAIETLDRSELSIKSDIWSLGVTFWEIFSFGKEPYQGLSYDLQFNEKILNGLRLPKPSSVDQSIYEKVLSCWNIDPDERPKAEDFIDVFQCMRNTSYTEL